MARPATIHISGFPGSGKTTLGQLLAKTFKTKVQIVETDDFIQHHTKEGKRLLKLQKQITDKKEDKTQYNKVWREILVKKFQEVLEKSSASVIVFVGSLDNFSLGGKLFWPKVDHKLLLNVELPELLQRYYTRIGTEEEKRPAIQSKEFWKHVAAVNYNILGSEEIVKSIETYNQKHTKHGYAKKTNSEILAFFKKIIANIVS